MKLCESLRGFQDDFNKLYIELCNLSVRGFMSGFVLATVTVTHMRASIIKCMSAVSLCNCMYMPIFSAWAQSLARLAAVAAMAEHPDAWDTPEQRETGVDTMAKFIKGNFSILTDRSRGTDRSH